MISYEECKKLFTDENSLIITINESIGLKAYYAHFTTNIDLMEYKTYYIALNRIYVRDVKTHILEIYDTDINQHMAVVYKEDMDNEPILVNDSGEITDIFERLDKNDLFPIMLSDLVKLLK